MSDDPWSDEFFSPQAQARRAAEAPQQADEERLAACQLLRQRGCEGAALIVASSGWRSDCVDNWDGGQYEVELAVPAALYDVARDEAVLAELNAAAEAVVGEKHFRGVVIALARSAAPAGWDATMASDIVAAARSRQQQPAQIESGTARMPAPG